MEQEFYHGMDAPTRDARAVGYMLAAFDDINGMMDAGHVEQARRRIAAVPAEIEENYGIRLPEGCR